MSRHLILLRHGETTFNFDGRMQGHLDTPLTDNGRAQARSAGEALVDAGITKIVTSDLSRARETAEIVGSMIGVPVEVDERLRETHLGKWQGMRHSDIDEQYPGDRARWAYREDWAPEGGETRTEVIARSRPVIEDLMVNYPDWEHNTVLLVSHGGTIKGLAASLLKVHPLMSGLGNACWAQLTARPHFNGLNTDFSGEGDDFVPHSDFTPGDVEQAMNADWYLDGWNLGLKIRRTR
ncbi:MAG: histidine phosphatase family protein [Corynebacterium sp.]|nr:histidine phosphatase family protein [Corynebacterium sp.]